VSRGLSGDMKAAAAAGTVRPVVFVEADFSGGVTRLCTWSHDLVWGGYTWTGRGDLLSIDAVEETESINARGVRVALSGIRPDLVALAFAEHYQGRELTLWQGLLDDDYAVIDAPFVLWAGSMDVMSIEIGDSATLTLTGAHRMADVDTPRGGRFNDADQQGRYAGDKFFEYLESMQNATIVWGFPMATSVTPPTGYGDVGTRGYTGPTNNTPAQDVGTRGWSTPTATGGGGNDVGTRGYS
jgi:hypothetical protein